MAEVKADINAPGKNPVEEFMQGNARIRIFDNYIVKSPEEKAKQDARISNICWRIVHAARANGKEI